MDAKTLGELVAKTLGLRSNDTLELKRDRLNPNRILVVRVREPQRDPSDPAVGGE